MAQQRPLRRVIPLFIAACLSLCSAASASAADDLSCTRVIPFRTGRNYIPDHGAKGLAQISVKPSDISVRNLLCLVRELRAGAPEWNDVMVLIFTSYEAADNWVVGHEMADYAGPAPPFEKWDRQLRATYLFDRTAAEEYLNILPLGWFSYTDESSTRIDLPAAALPHCRLEIADRCVLSLDRLDYPDVAARRISGSVTVSGRVTRQGRLTGVRVVAAQSSPASGKDILVREVLANLGTWRVDPASSDGTFETTYAYAIDPAVPQGGWQVDLAPSRVNVRVNPR